MSELKGSEKFVAESLKAYFVKKACLCSYQDGGDPPDIYLSIDNKINRFFDKLIGGWDIINSQDISRPNKTSNILLNQSSNVLQNQTLVDSVLHLKTSININILSTLIAPNAFIIQTFPNSIIASNKVFPQISIPKIKIVGVSLVVIFTVCSVVMLLSL